MRPFRAAALGLLAATFGLLLILFLRSPEENQAVDSSAPDSPVTSDPADVSQAEHSQSDAEVNRISSINPNTPPPTAVSEESLRDYGRSPLADGLNDPETSIYTDFRILHTVLDAYDLEYGSNPIGSSDEIIAALTGENPQGLAFIPTDHPALTPAGDLLDRWGQPLIFHPLSRHQTEIRSAGPDGIPWNEDDLSSLEEAQIEILVNPGIIAEDIEEPLPSGP